MVEIRVVDFGLEMARRMQIKKFQIQMDNELSCYLGFEKAQKFMVTSVAMSFSNAGRI